MSKELDTLWNNFINNTWQSMSVVPDTITLSTQQRNEK